MMALAVLNLIIWVIIGLMVLPKDEIKKRDYVVCYLVLMLSLFQLILEKL